jgi:hypothetical protein
VLGLLAAAVACGGDDYEPPSQIAVGVEVLEPDAPVDVEVTDVVQGDDGVFQHGVRVTWRGDETVRLDDVRFAHQVETADGDLITLGRGCGANWDEETEEVFLACTADLQLILVEPGESHEYSVRIPPEVGPLRLRPGTYVVEEPIHWWQQDDINAQPTAEGEFTLRLTYDVE